MRPFRTAAGMKAVNVSTNCWGWLSGGEYGELVGARDGRGVRASLGEARLQRLARPVVLAGAVVVDPVVEAPEREPEGDVVEAAREVRRELAFELWTHERAVRDQLERRATRRGLRLRVLRRERGLGVGAGAELEVVRVV